MVLTPEQLIKQQIMIDEQFPGALGDVDGAWDAFVASGVSQDAEDYFRFSGEPTGLECKYSRHYEAQAVGRELDNGTWVGWTYWHGGGHHGEPNAIPWMEDAYLLDVTEEEKVVIVRTFTKKD